MPLSASLRVGLGTKALACLLEGGPPHTQAYSPIGMQCSGFFNFLHHNLISRNEQVFSEVVICSAAHTCRVRYSIHSQFSVGSPTSLSLFTSPYTLHRELHGKEQTERTRMGQFRWRTRYMVPERQSLRSLP